MMWNEEKMEETMKRLTTDTPEGNFETMLNFVYGKDGAAHIRSDGERDGVPLHEWAKKQCIARGCGEFPGDTMQEIDETICDCGFDFPECPVHLAYVFACQAVHLRDRLKMYEDIGLEPEEIARERFLIAARKDPEKLARLRDLVFADEQGRVEILPPNDPLTLEELREMDGEPVWNDTMKKWAIVDIYAQFGSRTVGQDGRWRELTDRYYRRKPEEGRCHDERTPPQ